MSAFCHGIALNHVSGSRLQSVTTFVSVKRSKFCPQACHAAQTGLSNRVCVMCLWCADFHLLYLRVYRMLRPWAPLVLLRFTKVHLRCCFPWSMPTWSQWDPPFPRYTPWNRNPNPNDSRKIVRHLPEQEAKIIPYLKGNIPSSSSSIPHPPSTADALPSARIISPLQKGHDLSSGMASSQSHCMAEGPGDAGDELDQSLQQMLKAIADERNRLNMKQEITSLSKFLYLYI